MTAAMKRLAGGVAALVGHLIMGTAASAQTPSIERFTIDGGGGTSANGIYTLSATFGAATPYGDYSLELTGYHDRPPYAGVTQTIRTSPGVRYRLTLALGSNADYPSAGGRKQVSVTAGAAGKLITFDPTDTPGSGNEWKTFTFHFTAAEETTVITIRGVTAGGGIYLGLDNVSVVEAPLDLVRLTLTGIHFGADGFGFTLGGEGHEVWRIEYSDDLRTWRTIESGVSVGTEFVDTDPVRVARRGGLYRVLTE